ncbi:unnamed protein product [Cylindrotheca closterium]|uniref:Uncharacterized protein n=1 Tax=Cylindrotheca closterium TaxID=2856 RepID=A0AAD2CM56_9STRA|nr:unnamed protein product [Cylindrotheca closterium]
MWEQRNSVQHSDDNVQLRERHSTVNEGIHSQFDMGPDDLPKEIQPMLTSRRRVLRKSLVDKEEWLKLLCQERRDFRRSMKAQRRSLPWTLTNFLRDLTCPKFTPPRRGRSLYPFGKLEQLLYYYSLSEVVVAGIHGQASDKAPPNTVEKKWPTRLSYLKRVAGTTTSAQLPTLWHELAKCKKHESIGIVQSLLDDEAEKLNLNLEFIVSARVIKSLVELEFRSRGDVEKGLNVFNSVCFQHYKNANAINDYNKSDYWLTGEKTTASMKDHQAHDKIKHAIFPKDPMQFREMVNGMRVFYRVVFGKTHPLTAV